MLYHRRETNLIEHEKPKEPPSVKGRSFLTLLRHSVKIGKRLGIYSFLLLPFISLHYLYINVYYVLLLFTYRFYYIKLLP